MASIYSTGTASVTTGSAAVTGSGTAWAIALVTGGMFSSAGVSIPILSVDSDTTLTLAYVWPGSTASGATYAIARENSDAAGIVDLYDRLSRVLVTLSLAGITPNASGTLTQRDAIVLSSGDAGYLFLRAELGIAFSFYRWNGTAWEGPFPIAGEAGSSNVVGTSASSLAIATGAKTFTIVESARGWSAGARLRATSRANAANFMEGTVTSYSVNTLIMSIDLVGGSGTLADWNINLAGQQGLAGGVASVNGATGVVTVEAIVHAATGKTTPVDADELGIVDSAASNVLKKLTWANLKAGVLAYFNGTSKTTPLAADRVWMGNSAASNVPVYSTWTQILAAIFGTAAVKNTGTSGNTVPLLDGANTWSAAQTYSSPITLDYEGSNNSIAILTKYNATGGNELRYRRSRGTLASPTILSTNDVLGDLSFYGHDGVGFQSVGLIRCRAENTWSAGVTPTFMSFSTGDAASAVERLRITSAGLVSVSYSFGRGSPVTKTADFTVAATENWLINNKAASSCTVTLPTASAWSGREIMITNRVAFTVISASSNVVPLAGGAASTAILAATAGKWAKLVSDGTNWVIMQAA